MKKIIAALSGIFLSVAPCQARPAPEAARLQPKTAVRQTPLSEKDAAAVRPISYEELSKFSTDWTAYAQWLKSDGKESSLAYAGINPPRDYSEEAQKFLERRGWTVDRFFHLERTVRETLTYLIQTEKQENFTRRMEEQIRAVRENDSLSKKDRRLLEEQLQSAVERKSASVPPDVSVSPEELALIKANRDSLELLMSR